MTITPPETRARALALGWSAAVVMWALAYIAMMRPGLILGEVLFVLILLCPLVAGMVAGRDEASHSAPGSRGRLFRAVVAAAMAGLVTALVNLLIFGSLLTDPVTHQLRPNALWWIVGELVATIGLAKIGGMIGAMRARSIPAAPEAARPRGSWFNLFTRVGVLAAFLLLITGGLVTALRAGLAVPDWPNSFGHNMLLYPLSEMTGPLQRSQGVHLEHAHRLYGMLVGLTSIALAAGLFIYDRRWGPRMFGLAILAMVCVQGYMGGKRVTETSVPLAIVHGVFAQVVFASMVALAAVTSRSWLDHRLAAAHSPRAGVDRKLTIAAVILVILQIAVGAMYRHLRRGADDPGAHQHALFTHIVLALVVAVIVVLAAGRAWAIHGDSQTGGHPILKKCGKATIHTLLLQIALGIVATALVLTGKDSQAPVWEIALTTAHQVIGAVLLATTTLLLLWERRLLAPSPRLVESLS